MEAYVWSDQGQEERDAGDGPAAGSITRAGVPPMGVKVVKRLPGDYAEA
jgi:hypothetical protein